MIAQALALCGRAADLALPRRARHPAGRRRRRARVPARARRPRRRGSGDRAAAATRAPGDVGAELEFPLITEAQHAGRRRRPRATPGPRARRSTRRRSDDLEAVILRRGSSRRMDATATVPRATYEFSLAAALRGIDVPHFVAVHGVEGVEPGPLPPPRRVAPRGPPARRAAVGHLGSGPRPRRRLRRHRRGRPRRRSTTAATATPSSPRDSSKAACTSPPTRSASAPPA